MQPQHTARQDATAVSAPRLLGATKGGWKGRVATVFPQAGDYANDALDGLGAADAAARDVSIGGIGELMTQDYSAAFAN